MKTDWSALITELAIWRSEQRALPIWWRDDDAIADTQPLQDLFTLAEKTGVPVHLAVIPEPATKGLARAVADTDWAVPLIHGWAHKNNAPVGQKKAEFNHPRADAVQQIAAGFDRLTTLFGARLFPCFVPPWNRIGDDVVAVLGDQGYRALSTFTPRRARFAAPGLVQINTHIDPIHWRGSGGLVDPAIQIDAMVTLLQHRRQGMADRAEPLGLLTHHLVHDPDIWAFCATCLRVLLDGGATPVNLSNGDLP